MIEFRWDLNAKNRSPKPKGLNGTPTMLGQWDTNDFHSVLPPIAGGLQLLGLCLTGVTGCGSISGFWYC